MLSTTIVPESIWQGSFYCNIKTQLQYKLHWKQHQMESQIQYLGTVWYHYLKKKKRLYAFPHRVKTLIQPKLQLLFWPEHKMAFFQINLSEFSSQGSILTRHGSGKDMGPLLRVIVPEYIRCWYSILVIWPLLNKSSFLKQYTQPQNCLGVSLFLRRSTFEYSNIRSWASNVLHPVVCQSKNAFYKG